MPLHNVTLDPYDHYLAVQAAYVERFPDDPVEWAYGVNATAQKTARLRVVYHPAKDGGVGFSLEERYKALKYSSEVAMPSTLYQDGIYVELHCYGTRRQIFTYVQDGHILYGLKDRVATILRNSVKGPKNWEFSGSQFPQTDYSTSDTALWEWVLTGTLWIPVFNLDLAEDDGEPLPIEAADVIQETE